MSGRLLDIGSGPGFPGIPIKLARPALSVTLLEATKKKCNFCEEVIRELNLKDINVVHGRAEDGNIQKTASKFNVIISRATVSLEKLLEISQPYKMDNNSIVVAMKGALTEPEINGVSGKIKSIEEYKLPKNPSCRVLVFMN